MSSGPPRGAGGRAPLIGRTVPRVFTPPLVSGRAGPCGCGCALNERTSLGFGAIEFAAEVLGIVLFPWQRWLLIHALELLPDGRLRYRTVVLLVARQNGKTTVMLILALWSMYVMGRPLVIGTAQALDVAEEVWQAAVDIAEEIPELADEIAQVSQTNGKKFLRLVTGERYKVAAASRRGGRGLSGDLVLLDELREHQSWLAWSAVSKTTMAREHAQVWTASNAGDATSVVLRYLRKMAHLELGDPDGLAEEDDIEPEADEEVGEDGDELDDDMALGIFEWSAQPGCSKWDRDGWAQANPSLGCGGVTERALRSAAKTDPEHVFRPECLCQWLTGSIEGPFPPGAWQACEDPESEIVDRPAFCLAVSADRSTSYVGAAGGREDGVPAVEVVEWGDGTEWVVDWFRAKKSRMATPVVVQAKGAPESSLVEDLRTAGVKVVEWSSSEISVACGDFYDRVRRAVAEESPSPGLRHRGQPALTIAAENASTRPSGDAFVWDLLRSSVDVAPLKAVTGALWLVTAVEPAEESGDFIVI